MFEDAHEFASDNFSLRLRIGHTFEEFQKTIGRIHVLEPDVKIFRENALHHFCLTRAQQAVVHKDAGELVADRLVQQCGHDGRVHPAAQPEHNLLVAHLPPHALARFLDERPHRPVHRAATDVEDKILQDLFPARGVRHFRMKLEAVKFSVGIFDRGESGILGMRGGAESSRQRRHLVAVAAPDIDLLADAVEEFRAIRYLEHARPVFAAFAEFHLPAEVVRHQLHPVANSQHRKAERKYFRIELRRPLVVNAGWPSGKHDSLGAHRRDFFRRNIEANDFRIDLALANAPRDYLSVLRAEIENENPGVRRSRSVFHGWFPLM